MMFSAAFFLSKFMILSKKTRLTRLGSCSVTFFPVQIAKPVPRFEQLWVSPSYHSILDDTKEFLMPQAIFTQCHSATKNQTKSLILTNFRAKTTFFKELSKNGPKNDDGFLSYKYMVRWYFKL